MVVRSVGFLVCSCTVLFVAGCATGGNPKKLNVDVVNPDGDSLGVVTMEEGASGVDMTFDLEGLPPGEHAVHFHEKGSCEGSDFESASNHFNPDDKSHGLLNPEGAHAGDLPNVIADDQGVVNVELTAPQATLAEGKTTLYTTEGTSLVIHELADDGMSQPAGNAGARIACGEISKNGEPVDQEGTEEAETEQEKE